LLSAFSGAHKIIQIQAQSMSLLLSVDVWSTSALLLEHACPQWALFNIPEPSGVPGGALSEAADASRSIAYYKSFLVFVNLARVIHEECSL